MKATVISLVLASALVAAMVAAQERRVEIKDAPGGRRSKRTAARATAWTTCS